MRREIPLKDGDEWDALTVRASVGWRQFYHYKPGERRYIKNKFNRRSRHTCGILIEREVAQYVTDCSLNFCARCGDENWGNFCMHCFDIARGQEEYEHYLDEMDLYYEFAELEYNYSLTC